MNEPVRSAESNPPTKPPMRWGALFLYLVFGAIAGGASWYLIEDHREYFGIPEELTPTEVTFNPDPETTQKLADAKGVARQKNHALALGFAGVMIVGLLSVLPGLTSGSVVRTIAGLICGVVLGGVSGVLAGYTGIEVFDYVDTKYRGQDTTDGLNPWQLYNTMSAHAAFWGIVGVGLTISLSLVGGKRVFIKLLMTTIGVGIFWCLCYPFTAAILFPLQTTDIPIPYDKWSTLYWIGTYSLLVSLGVGRVLLRAPVEPVSVPAPQ